MYNSKDLTLDKDLTALSYNQTINAEFTVEQIKNSSLWYIKSNENNILTVIPLFNCDTIQSNNKEDIIMENKMLILQNNDNTIITCNSEDTGNINYQKNYKLYAFAPYTKLDKTEEVPVYCIYYDENLNPIPNEEIQIQINNENTTTQKTNNKGICKTTINTAGTIKFINNDIESNTITINEE